MRRTKPDSPAACGQIIVSHAPEAWSAAVKSDIGIALFDLKI
jgi:hypothetical protein